MRLQSTPMSAFSRLSRLTPGFKTTLAALLLALPGIAPAAGEEELPLWELGLGVGALATPHYPGAEQDHNLLMPIPYPVYRGEWLRSDGSGVRALLADAERYELNVSFSGTFPVDSQDNDARRGMPDLGWLLEIGPTLRYTAWQSEDRRSRLRLDLPVRGALSLDGSDLVYRGVTVSPGLEYQTRLGQWQWRATGAASFASRRFNGFYYDVKPAQAVPGRPSYRASAGYFTSRFSLSVTRRLGNWLAGAFASYRSLHGAANNTSPLVRQRNNFSGGLMLVWFFKQSEATVTEDPELEF